jgi:protein ImuB
MLWIAVHLPNLPLEVLIRSADCSQPCCVMQDHAVLAANETACAAGLHVGMRRATALALLPELQILERDIGQERGVLESIALALLRFTPQVVIDFPCLLLEVEGSRRLFGGIRALLSSIATAVDHCGVTHRMATAVTAAGASLIARSALPRRHALQAGTTCALLNAVSLRHVTAALPHLETLRGLGCETLGDVRRLPRGGCKRRFGIDLLRELDRAYGEEADVRDGFQAPNHFKAELELMARVDNAEALVFASRRLVQQLCGWLSAHWTAVSVFRLVMKHESLRRSLPDSQLTVALAERSRDPEHLLTVLKERLQRLVLPAPVYHLGLEVDRVAPFAGENAALLPDPARAATDFTRLIDRLKARLGDETVYRLALVADFRPEKGACAVPVQGSPPQPMPDVPQLPRPSWLLPDPIRLVERDNKPFYQSPLNLVSGPERIEYGWFDGELVQRDYYVAENDRHALLWIYRERDALAGGWYLQGLFG